MGGQPSAADYATAGQEALRVRQFGHAADCFDRALQLNPRSPEGLAGLALLAWERDRDPDRMHATLERARRAAPRHAAVHNLLGTCHLIRGDLATAEKAARKALQCQADFVYAYPTLHHAAPIATDSKDFRTLQALVKGGRLDARARSICLHLVGRIFEGERAFDEAFDAYSRANAIAPNSFDASHRFDSLARIVGDLAPEDPPSEQVGPPSVIFLVGMPRSGSTLLEQVLSQHSQTVSIGEAKFAMTHFDGVFGMPSLRPLTDDALAVRRRHLDADKARRYAANYLRDAREMAGSDKIIVDKCLYNFPLVPLLLKYIPGARVVDCRRDPLDIAISIWANNLVVRPFSGDQETLARFYNVYARTMQRWHAAGWPGLSRITYEDVIAEPGAHIPALLERLNLPFEEACLRPEESANPVSTASISQVRTAINTGSIGRGRRFARHLAPFMQGIRGASH